MERKHIKNRILVLPSAERHADKAWMHTSRSLKWPAPVWWHNSSSERRNGGQGGRKTRKKRPEIWSYPVNLGVQAMWQTGQTESWRTQLSHSNPASQWYSQGSTAIGGWKLEHRAGKALPKVTQQFHSRARMQGLQVLSLLAASLGKLPSPFTHFWPVLGERWSGWDEERQRDLRTLLRPRH